MINVDDLYIVNYCHPNCKPFMNICRLPEDEAFSLAYRMAAENSDATAFGRFVDFGNYYPRRMRQDEYLYDMFASLGGKPREKHPLSFVLQGSEYLYEWFGKGIISKIRLRDIPSEYVSFTLGDSGSALVRDGGLTMYTKETLLSVIREYDGTMDDFLGEIERAHHYHYIEAQLWNDDYCALAEIMEVDNI